MGNPPYPEAALLGRARRARRFTLVQAAEAAGISHQRWSQIEGSKGKRAPAETIAHMARAVGVTPDRLMALDPDLAEAAEILEEIELQEAAGTDAFETKAREAIRRLPGAERSAAEELLEDLIAAERQNRTFQEKFVLFVSRAAHGKVKSDDQDEEGVR